MLEACVVNQPSLNISILNELSSNLVESSGRLGSAQLQPYLYGCSYTYEYFICMCAFYWLCTVFVCGDVLVLVFM